MRKLIALVLALAMLPALAAGALAGAYRLSEVHAEGYPTSLADREFARLVEERSKGRIKIEVYTGATLYSEETAAIEALQVGDLAFTRVSASPVASYVPAINAIQMPYLYKSGDHMWAVLNGEIGKKLLADIEASGSGLVGLCYYDAGSRCFYLTRGIKDADGIKGLKIRMQNNKMMVRMVELLGGTGVTGIGPNEVYSAIQTGTVDGAENNWPTYQNMGDYEVAKYYILDQHTRVPEILLMSKVVKDDLSKEDFDLILKCAADTQAFEIQKWAEKEKSSEEIVRKAGTTVVELTPAGFASFQSKMAPLYDEFGSDFKDILAQIQKVGEKF
ncbi:MAG: TRAP transporter substrate-binding protein [Planctomycetota bacterium]|jgi:tripartite ATP-independent transporter DctP family solute receptor|nr:TRAP transporter substrate-binding protein [Planctomycetota bacterium]